MENRKKVKRAGALCLACVVLLLSFAGVYLQASEGGGGSSVQHTEVREIPEEATEPPESERMAESSGEGTAGEEAAKPLETEAAGGEATKPLETGTAGGEATKPLETEAAWEEATEPFETGTAGEGTTEAPGSEGVGEQATDTPDSQEGQSEYPGSEAGTEAQTESRPDRDMDQAEESGPETTTETSEMQGGMPESETFTDTGMQELPETETEFSAGSGETAESDEDNDTGEGSTELTPEEVIEEAQRQDIDIFGLAPGESLTFYASVSQDDGIMPVALTAVTVTRAPLPYEYEDYGFGTWHTCRYVVSFNNITAVAYCVRPTLDDPETNNYAVTKLKGAKTLAKVCYYGTKAAGSEGFFEERYPDFSEGHRYIITHLAASYANGSPDTFAGTNQRAQNLAKELYQYCVEQPDIPEVDMEFSDADVEAYIDPADPQRQRTATVRFRADTLQSVTFRLPAGVVLHNVSTGEASKAGAKVTVSGGTKFYLSAPLSQAVDTGTVWSSTMKGSVTKDYSAYKIVTGATSQDLVLVFGEGVDDECYVDFSVKWLEMASVDVLKTDEETGKGLQGAVFGIYADQNCTELLATMQATDAQGRTSAQIARSQDTVYLRELTPPAGYVRSTQVKAVDLRAAAKTGSVSCTIADKRVTARLRLQKRDAQTGTAQGDAVLEHAVYGLYARADIIHPDGSTGVLFRAGEQVAALTTDASGEASAENLYLGKYYLKEISPSNGYLLDEKEYDITFDASENTDGVIEKECLSKETVIRQPFQLIKIAGNGKTDGDMLEGAGFSAYLASSLQIMPDGSYDFAAAAPVVLGENGATEIFTDRDGYAVSVPLAFGTYIVRETTVPAGYAAVDDFEVRITENNPAKPQAWRVLIDEEFEAKLKIVKSDDETQRNVLRENTEFKVYDLDAGKYVEQVTTYPKEVKHSSYFTDAEGYLILPQSLPRGHYRIEEVSAPDGYTVGDASLEVAVDNNTAYRMDNVSGDAVIEVVASNHPVKGTLRVVKKGEVPVGYEDDFEYEERPLSGAVYEVYAAEDIYTADMQRDEAGDRILEYAQGALAGEIVTGENGEGILENLPLGRYKVTEKTAPDGYVFSEEEQNAQFVYVDQDTPVVVESVEFVNERQKAEISAVKKDAVTGEMLAGAEFGLFAKNKIESGGRTIAEADTQLATAVTGEDGRAVFGDDLPLGEYYVRELQAPDGFILSDESVDVTASYQGQDTETVYLEAVFEDEPTVTEFTKSDIATGTELDGATLSVLDQEGNVVETWISERGKPHTVRRLHVGETYVLREEFAPYGYLRAEEVEFTVSDTGEIQKVEMKDAVPVGRIVISKTGEFVDSVTWEEMVAGAVEAVFGYLSGALGQVVFEIRAAEDIRAADGLSRDYYKKDELVETVTTDSLGYARSGDLPLGKYYVVEKETAEGFVLDQEPREIDLSYRDQDTAVVTYDEVWQNARQRAAVTVLKKEKNKDRMLAGGVFALCAGEDITGADGETLIKADTVIEQKVTDADGRLVFRADLPLGGAYYVKEVKAPAGYVRTDEIREFTFTYAGEETEEVAFEFLFENQPTRIEVSKTDITTGAELPGAYLQVKDGGGKVVDSWTSGRSPHMIRGLEAGKTYTLREETAPWGYAVAEEVSFKVKNTGEIQHVEMKDDYAAGRVLISKTDRDTGRPMQGVEFAFCDSSGRLLETLVTDREGRAASSGYPVAVRENGVFKEEAFYILKETKTLAGYRLDGTEHRIRFADRETGVVTAECRLELKNERLGEAPATGDKTDFLLPAAGMAVSGCAAMLLAFTRKRNKKLS